MKIEIIPNQVWVDVEQPTLDTDSHPASLILPMSFNHIFNDRYTEYTLRLRLELKFSKIKLGSQISHVELPPGMRNEKYDIEFLLLPELS